MTNTQYHQVYLFPSDAAVSVTNGGYINRGENSRSSINKTNRLADSCQQFYCKLESFSHTLKLKRYQRSQSEHVTGKQIPSQVCHEMAYRVIEKICYSLVSLSVISMVIKGVFAARGCLSGWVPFGDSCYLGLDGSMEGPLVHCRDAV